MPRLIGFLLAVALLAASSADAQPKPKLKITREITATIGQRVDQYNHASLVRMWTHDVKVGSVRVTATYEDPVIGLRQWYEYENSRYWCPRCDRKEQKAGKCPGCHVDMVIPLQAAREYERAQGVAWTYGEPQRSEMLRVAEQDYKSLMARYTGEWEAQVKKASDQLQSGLRFSIWVRLPAGQSIPDSPPDFLLFDDKERWAQGTTKEEETDAASPYEKLYTVWFLHADGRPSVKSAKSFRLQIGWPSVRTLEEWHDVGKWEFSN